jgi:pimeloyl-ACP methyl ester carboxylesterase
MRKTLKIFLSSVFLCFLSTAFAEMPNTPCHSVCMHSNTTGCIHLNQQYFYYRSQGKGSPTMIFSSGTGFPADGWFESGIASALTQKTKVFAYDRIYTFNSCPNKNDFLPVTAEDVVTNLRALLKQENIKPPYILVGHSMGGLYMLLYAREFPDEVAGIVLMDASTDNGPTPFPKESKKILTKLGNPQNPTPENPLYNEMIGQLPSYLQMQKAPALSKNIPLIVMYATKHCLPLAWTKKPMCMTVDQEETHYKHQLDLYNMSQNHKLIRVEGDHMSFFTKEKLPIVTDALTNMLDMSSHKER